MGKGSPTEVTGHLFLHSCGVAVSYGLVPLQGALVGQLRGAFWALPLIRLGHGAALHVGPHATLVGKALLTPVAGVGLGGGGRRGGVCCSIWDFVVLFVLLLSIFLLSLSLVLLLLFTCGTVLVF